jgi:type I restriction enzyme S subunit
VVTLSGSRRNPRRLAAGKESVGKTPERYKLVEPGTIFYNPMRILLGSIAYLDEGQKPGITSPDYVVFRTKPGVMHPRWFYYWLRSDDGAAFIRTLTRGAVRERMLFRRLANAENELPAVISQASFAHAIGYVDTMRAALDTQLQTCQRLAAAWIRGIFGTETMAG